MVTNCDLNISSWDKQKHENAIHYSCSEMKSDDYNTLIFTFVIFYTPLHFEASQFYTRKCKNLRSMWKNYTKKCINALWVQSEKMTLPWKISYILYNKAIIHNCLRNIGWCGWFGCVAIDNWLSGWYSSANPDNIAGVQFRNRLLDTRCSNTTRTSPILDPLPTVQ